MTQKVDPRSIKFPDSSNGFILRINDQGDPVFSEIVAGPGTLDSNSLIESFENYLVNLDSNVLPDSSGRVIDIGSDSYRVKSIFISDSVNVGSLNFTENKFILVNGEQIKRIDSNNVLNTIDSNYISQRAENAEVQGPQGVVGPTGTIGAQGVKGESLQGSQGLQGIDGFSGPPREQVLQGVQGCTGIPGFCGGATGLQGIQGIQGCCGIVGERGSKGTQGIQGPSGLDGVSGAQGAQGSQGVCGVDGQDGCLGTQGVRGFQGFQGTIIGTTGPQGITGTTSSIQGTCGIQGPRGFDGTQTGTGCIQGIQGIKGTANNVQGPQGLSGLDLAGGALRLSCLLDASVETYSGASNVALGYCAEDGLYSFEVINVGICAGGGGTSFKCCNISIGGVSGAPDVQNLESVQIGYSAARYCNKFSNRENVHIGSFTQAGDGFNVAVGFNAGHITATSDRCAYYSVAIGSNTEIIGESINSIVIGSKSKVRGSNSIAIGGCICGTGDPSGSNRNVWIGYQAAYAGGFNANCQTQENTAIGTGAQNGFCTCFRLRNTSVGANTLNYYGYKTCAFGSGCLVSCFYCNTGIGTAAGNAIRSCGSIPRIKNITFIGAYSLKYLPSYNNAIYLGPSTTCTIRSNVTSITSLSDCRDKTCIEPINYGLDFVNSMNPVSFYWNDRDSDGRRDQADIGFISQELLALESDQGSKDYTRLITGDENKLFATPMRSYPIAIKAIQELKNQINRLKEDFQSLKDEV